MIAAAVTAKATVMATATASGRHGENTHQLAGEKLGESTFFCVQVPLDPWTATRKKVFFWGWEGYVFMFLCFKICASGQGRPYLDKHTKNRFSSFKTDRSKTQHRLFWAKIERVFS
jgi:hypothetical protein